MNSTLESQLEILNTADNLIQWSARILNDAPLNEVQRQDVQAIYYASRRFYDFAQSEIHVILEGQDARELQRVRHQLRNYLNIIVGFSRLLVRELPDNLLMHMILLRQIHSTGQILTEQVNTIR